MQNLHRAITLAVVLIALFSAIALIAMPDWRMWALQPAPAIEASGGLNTEEFRDICELQYRRDDREQLTSEEYARLSRLQRRATPDHRSIARCQHRGTKFVLDDEQKKNPVLVAIARAFTSTDPIPQQRKWGPDEYIVTAYHCSLNNLDLSKGFMKPIRTPLPFKRNVDGTYTITIIFTCEIAHRDHGMHAHYTGGTLERWRWDGETLTCESVEYWTAKGTLGGISS